jgi:hypothetical protein
VLDVAIPCANGLVAARVSHVAKHPYYRRPMHSIFLDFARAENVEPPRSSANPEEQQSGGPANLNLNPAACG